MGLLLQKWWRDGVPALTVFVRKRWAQADKTGKGGPNGAKRAKRGGQTGGPNGSAGPKRTQTGPNGAPGACPKRQEVNNAGGGVARRLARRVLFLRCVMHLRVSLFVCCLFVCLFAWEGNCVLFLLCWCT